MGLSMIRDGDAFRPAAICDQCRQEVARDGLVLWRIDGEPGQDSTAGAFVVCDEACAEALMDRHSPDDDWAATSFDAYLASLIDLLGVDTAEALARERAAQAAIHTRDEAPD